MKDLPFVLQYSELVHEACAKIEYLRLDGTIPIIAAYKTSGRNLSVSTFFRLYTQTNTATIKTLMSVTDIHTIDKKLDRKYKDKLGVFIAEMVRTVLALNKMYGKTKAAKLLNWDVRTLDRFTTPNLITSRSILDKCINIDNLIFNLNSSELAEFRKIRRRTIYPLSI